MLPQLTAHTANDQSETILMRLASGSGLRGLRGIREWRDGILRPWLAVTRDTVKRGQQKWGPGVEDPSNRSYAFAQSGAPQLMTGKEHLGRIMGKDSANSALYLSHAHELLEELLEPYFVSGCWRRTVGSGSNEPDLRI